MEKPLTRRNQVYHPVNTAVLKAFQLQSDDNFQLNGHPVEIIEIIAKVEDVTESGLRLEFRFSDEFGEFVGVIYRKQGGSSPALRGYDIGRRGYAAVVGTVKRFYSTLTIVIGRITPVYDFLTVLQHRLRVIWAFGVREGKIAPSRLKSEFEQKPPVAGRQTESQGPQASILQALKKSYTILSESNKVPLARQLGMPVGELERHLSGMTQMGYLYKDEISGRYVVMDGN